MFSETSDDVFLALAEVPTILRALVWFKQDSDGGSIDIVGVGEASQGCAHVFDLQSGSIVAYQPRAEPWAQLDFGPTTL